MHRIRLCFAALLCFAAGCAGALNQRPASASPTPAPAHLGYVDAQRVYAESTEARRVTGEVQSDHDAKQREINAAQEAATKAKGAEQKTLQEKALTLARQDQAALDEHQKTASATLRTHLAPVLAGLKAERHLVDILPVVPLTPSGDDLTDEAIRRWNAADLDAATAENAKLKAELAALKATPPPASKK